MAVLERGGNAFDAAVAAGFTLQVAEPHLNGPGGDAPIIIHDAKTGTQHVICGQGAAPDSATPEKFARTGSRPHPRHRPAARRGAGRIRRLGADAARLGHHGAGRRAVLRHRLRHQRHPSGAARARGHRDACARCSSRNGKPPPRSGCPAARCPRPAPCSAAPRWPRPGSAWCAKAPAPPARRASTPPATPSTAAASPRRSAGSTATQDILDASGRRHRGLLTADDMAPLGRHGGRPRQPRLPRPYRAEMSAPGARAPRCCRRSRC